MLAIIYLFPLFVHGQKPSGEREGAVYPSGFLVMYQLGNNELELGSHLGKGLDCTPSKRHDSLCSMITSFTQVTYIWLPWRYVSKHAMCVQCISSHV